MSCAVPLEVVQGSRGVYIAYEVTERNAAGQRIAVDLTLAATAPGYAQAFFRPPGVTTDAGLIMRPAVVVAPFEEGRATYQTEAGFLDRIGAWETMLEVYLPGSGQGLGLFHSRVVRFEVVRALRGFQGVTPSLAGGVELGVAAPSVIVAA